MIRILRFTGGLGNQITGYAVYLHFRNKYPKDLLCICYGKDLLSEHNGCFELPSFFEVDLPKPNIWYMRLWHLTDYIRKFISLNSLFDRPGSIVQNEKAIFCYAHHNSKIYIPQAADWLRFKEPHLSPQNVEILRQIKSSNSVFIHVRRGDYLSPQYINRFKNICTLEYYHKAIHIVEERLPNAKYFIFSDDIEYVKQNLTGYLSDLTLVDWNKGLDSYLDMYLMAHCKAGIIANSSFSYWAARLVQKKIIVYPQKWVNGSDAYPDFFEDYWQGI